MCREAGIIGPILQMLKPDQEFHTLQSLHFSCPVYTAFYHLAETGLFWEERDNTLHGVHLFLSIPLIQGWIFCTSKLKYFIGFLSMAVFASNIFTSSASRWCWKMILKHNMTSPACAQKHCITPCACQASCVLFKILRYLNTTHTFSPPSYYIVLTVNMLLNQTWVCSPPCSKANNLWTPDYSEAKCSVSCRVNQKFQAASAQNAWTAQ